MKTTITLSAAAIAVSAIAANAEMIESSFSAELINIYALRPDGSEYHQKDEECKNQFDHFIGKTVSGSYKIDADRDAGGGELTFEDNQMQLMPVKVGDVWGFYTTEVPEPLINQFIQKINVTPGEGPEGTRAEVVIAPTPDEFHCIAANHGRDQ